MSEDYYTHRWTWQDKPKRFIDKPIPDIKKGIPKLAAELDKLLCSKFKRNTK